MFDCNRMIVNYLCFIIKDLAQTKNRKCVFTVHISGMCV